ncbi:MAG: CRISPR-associated helicase Cas3' [Candidatus Korarchaeum sp.]
MGLTDYVESILTTIPERKRRPFLYHASLRAEESSITVIEAPTGYGKTVISQAMALRSLDDGLKCIVSFPLRTLLEDQLSKFRETFRSLKLNDKLIGARYMHHPGSRYLSMPITLTTVDTLSLTLFGIAPEDIGKAFGRYDGTSTGSLGHYLFSRAMVLLSDLVLDEVHLLSDSTKSLNFLVALIRIFAEHGGRITFMSATIPNSLKKLLRDECKDIGISIVEFSEDSDEDFLNERKRKRYSLSLEKLRPEDKFDGILEFLREARRDGFRRSIVVFNTVREAISFYDRVRRDGSLVSEDKLLLIHSRFTGEDRERIFGRVKELRGSEEYLIVSTQVIEAGVDVSSDIFVTDLAPAASLIQRLGRFLRYDEKCGRVMIWYESLDGNRYKGVYDTELVRSTLHFLEDESDVNFHVPSSYKRLLDHVYPECSFTVNPSEVRDLINIPMALRDPFMAIRKFMELEGSFVRESTLVPVVPSSLVRDHLRVEDMLIPMDLSVVCRIRPDEELVRKGCSTKGGKRSSPPERVPPAHSGSGPTLVERVKIEDSFWLPEERVKEKVIRHMLSSCFVAFIMKGRYDRDLGMVIEHEGEGP